MAPGERLQPNIDGSKEDNDAESVAAVGVGGWDGKRYACHAELTPRSKRPTALNTWELRLSDVGCMLQPCPPLQTTQIGERPTRRFPQPSWTAVCVACVMQ